MQLIAVAPGVTQLALVPRQAINAYLIGSVLIDAGIRTSATGLLKVLAPRPLSAHVLTHAHADHQGASAAICTSRQIPLWCSQADRQRAEQGNVTSIYPDPHSLMSRFQQRYLAGPGHPVDRTLQEGDSVEDFTVIAAPGHTPGMLAFWREHDRVLILGDVLANINLLTTIPGLHEPPRQYTTDPVENRRSIKKLAALQPKVVCFGHGPVLRDPAALQAFVARLP